MKRTPLYRRTGLTRTGFRSRNKFHAIPVHNTVTGETFDSTGESVRWATLQLLERAGEIRDLTRAAEARKIILLPRVGTIREIAWRIDAVYTDRRGVRVWEDFKPRPITERERLLLNLWQRYGPGRLLIVGNKGKVLRDICPETTQRSDA